MKKAFSLIELIITVSLLSVVFIFTFLVIKKSEPTYADPYEDVRLLISDATSVYLNSNIGLEFKKNLYDNGKIIINSNSLIQEGLLEESYFLKNINQNIDLKNVEIIVLLDGEGFINYSINI